MGHCCHPVTAINTGFSQVGPGGSPPRAGTAPPPHWGSAGTSRQGGADRNFVNKGKEKKKKTPLSPTPPSLPHPHPLTGWPCPPSPCHSRGDASVPSLCPPHRPLLQSWDLTGCPHPSPAGGPRVEPPPGDPQPPVPAPVPSPASRPGGWGRGHAALGTGWPGWGGHTGVLVPPRVVARGGRCRLARRGGLFETEIKKDLQKGSGSAGSVGGEGAALHQPWGRESAWGSWGQGERDWDRDWEALEGAGAWCHGRAGGRRLPLPGGGPLSMWPSCCPGPGPLHLEALSPSPAARSTAGWARSFLPTPDPRDPQERARSSPPCRVRARGTWGQPPALAAAAGGPRPPPDQARHGPWEWMLWGLGVWGCACPITSPRGSAQPGAEPACVGGQRVVPRPLLPPQPRSSLGPPYRRERSWVGGRGGDTGGDRGAWGPPWPQGAAGHSQAPDVVGVFHPAPSAKGAHGGVAGRGRRAGCGAVG